MLSDIIVMHLAYTVIGTFSRVQQSELVDLQKCQAKREYGVQGFVARQPCMQIVSLLCRSEASTSRRRDCHRTKSARTSSMAGPSPSAITGRQGIFGAVHKVRYAIFGQLL